MRYSNSTATKIALQNFVSAYECCSDKQALFKIDNTIKACMDTLNNKHRSLRPHEKVVVWADGSYNEDKKKSGIGIVIKAHDRTIRFGKPVKSDGSRDTEIYAAAIGLSYALNRFENLKLIELKCDCNAAASCVPAIDALCELGTPYTNLRSAIKRAKKQGISIIFHHVKGHYNDFQNNMCDMIARYHSESIMTDKEIADVKRALKQDKKYRKEKGS